MKNDLIVHQFYELRTKKHKYATEQVFFGFLLKEDQDSLLLMMQTGLIVQIIKEHIVSIISLDLPCWLAEKCKEYYALFTSSNSIHLCESSDEQSIKRKTELEAFKKTLSYDFAKEILFLKPTHNTIVEFYRALVLNETSRESSKIQISLKMPKRNETNNLDLVFRFELTNTEYLENENKMMKAFKKLKATFNATFVFVDASLEFDLDKLLEQVISQPNTFESTQRHAFLNVLKMIQDKHLKKKGLPYIVK